MSSVERQKAPAGCFWKGDVLYARTRIKGRLIRWSLETNNPQLAAQKRKESIKRIETELRIDGGTSIEHALPHWRDWLEDQRSASEKTIKRYMVSIGQLSGFLANKRILDIGSRLVAEIVRQRGKAGVTSATVKRDLVALSSFCNFCIGEGYLEDNPVLPRMRQIKEKRDPIVLPRWKDIETVIRECPGMIADMVRVAVATGAREDELLRADHDHVDRKLQQLTIIGKRNKRRVIDIKPFRGFEIIAKLPRNGTNGLIFWHSAGENYKNFASQFSAIVSRVEEAQGESFRRFTFHHLRHFHAVQWLKDGRSIYALQKRLGHTSIKTTEIYLDFLTDDEERIVKEAN